MTAVIYFKKHTYLGKIKFGCEILMETARTKAQMASIASHHGAGNTVMQGPIRLMNPDVVFRLIVTKSKAASGLPDNIVSGNHVLSNCICRFRIAVHSANLSLRGVLTAQTTQAAILYCYRLLTAINATGSVLKLPQELHHY